ncbi:MAG: peptidoglycan DD-metalloendopeptidase family protein [Methylococcales bacterium]|nr:peptidoglycan DD-metalloendopeptidase family protein [Methylococcales bacterium]
MSKCLTLAGILFSIGVAPAYAINSTQADHAELKSVQSKMLRVDGNIDHLQAQQQVMQNKLAELEEKIGQHAIVLKALQNQVDQKNQEMTATEKSIRTQKGRIDRQKKVLKDQILAAYEAGRHDRLKLVLNQQDPAVSGRMLVYYDYLNKVRLHDVAQIESDVVQLGALQHKQSQALDVLTQALQRKQAEQALLTETKQSRALVLQQLHTELLVDKNLLSQLKSDEQELRALIGGLQQKTPRKRLEEETPTTDLQVTSVETELVTTQKKTKTVAAQVISGKSFGQLKGHLSWPVAGKINRQLASEQPENVRGGVLIVAPEGNAVRTVAKGRVAYAGWLRGYGMLTIVEHDDGYMTIYAFNQSLYKKAGAAVKAGEVIASVGQSGGQRKAGLYFEIRRRGLPLNPESWCEK